MDCEMGARIRKQLRVRNNASQLYCEHDNEKPCAECMARISGSVSYIRGDVSDIRGDVSEILAVLKKEEKEG